MINRSESFLELAARRQSVRHYTPEPIPRASLDRCLEAARLAPSANNGQPWNFIVAGDDSVRIRLAQAARFGALGQNPFAMEAPAIVAVVEGFGHRPTRWGGRLLGRDFPLLDIGMAAEHFCLQAAEEGLGTCILGLFQNGAARRALGLGRNRRVRLLISVGFPADAAIREKKRRPRDGMSRYIVGKGILDGSRSD